MWIVGFLTCLLCLQVTIGGLLLGLGARGFLLLPDLKRRSRVRWHETSRTALLLAATASLPAAGLLVTLQAMDQPAVVLRSPGGLWAPLVLGGLAATSGLLILAAGRVEARGQRRRASRRVDTAGRAMFLACSCYAGVLVGATILAPATVRSEILPELWSPVWLVAAATSLGLAGFIGLLAGLARKPRPSGTFAILLYAASQWALMAALGI